MTNGRSSWCFTVHKTAAFPALFLMMVVAFVSIICWDWQTFLLVTFLVCKAMTISWNRVNLNTKCLRLYFTCNVVHILPDIALYCHIIVTLYFFHSLFVWSIFFLNSSCVNPCQSLLSFFFFFFSPVCLKYGSGGKSAIGTVFWKGLKHL